MVDIQSDSMGFIGTDVVLVKPDVDSMTGEVVGSWVDAPVDARDEVSSDT